MLGDLIVAPALLAQRLHFIADHADEGFHRKVLGPETRSMPQCLLRLERFAEQKRLATIA